MSVLPPLAVVAAAALLPVVYRPPVDAPVADRFRPPAAPYGAGNRGVEYATPPGAEVRAVAPGVVAFAGRVGTTLHVSIVHADGLRTTYSYLQADVRRGDRVEAGEVVGRAGERFHLGARVGDAYLDPEQLFGVTKGRAHLVPDDEAD